MKFNVTNRVIEIPEAERRRRIGQAYKIMLQMCEECDRKKVLQEKSRKAGSEKLLDKGD